MKKAFTLTELAVVATIMVVLSTMALVVLAPARAKTRDVRRLADFKVLYDALEWYFHDNSKYPIWAGGGCIEDSNASSTPFLNNQGFVGAWVSKIPQDPLYNKGKGHCYYYKTDSYGTNYHFLAKMERDSQAVTDDGGLFNYIDYRYYEIFAARENLDTTVGVDASTTLSIMNSH